MMHVHKWNSDIDATEIGRFDPYMDTEGRTGLGFNYSDYILRLSKFRWYCFETRNADQGHAFLTYSATGSTGIIRPNLIRRKIIRKTRFRRWSNFEARKNTIEKNCKKKINEGLKTYDVNLLPVSVVHDGNGFSARKSRDSWLLTNLDVIYGKSHEPLENIQIVVSRCFRIT